MTTKTDKPKRRLKDVTVDAIGLVDKGAVQAADFVVLSKRIETEVPDTTESEIVKLAKAMDEDTAYEASNVLRIMAEMMQLGVALKRCKSKLPPEIAKAFDDLKAARHDEKVKKTETPVEVPEEPVKKSAEEQFAEAVELLDRQDREKAELIESQAIDRVLAKCEDVLNVASESKKSLD